MAAIETTATVSKKFQNSSGNGGFHLHHHQHHNLGKYREQLATNSNVDSLKTNQKLLSKATRVATLKDSEVQSTNNGSSVLEKNPSQEDREEEDDDCVITTTTTTMVKHEICCLLAEGSSTRFIGNFSSMREFYTKISHSFDISIKEIMYCTLNTPKIDMDQVLTGQICLNDIVFIHRKGKCKEVEVRKTEPFLGLTIANNGNGCSYIKKIRPESTASRVPFIQVGDHIESIMDETMVGRRHYEVAHFLKMIPLNQIFTICLVEPVSSDELRVKHNPSEHSEQLSSLSPQPPRLTILNGEIGHFLQHKHHQHHCYIDGDSQLKWHTGLYYINKQLEQFLGIDDDELAQELWLIATTIVDGTEWKRPNPKTKLIVRHTNPMDFIEMIENSDLNDFKFTNDFLYEIWAIVNDVLNGTIAVQQPHLQNGNNGNVFCEQPDDEPDPEEPATKTKL